MMNKRETIEKFLDTRDIFARFLPTARAENAALAAESGDICGLVQIIGEWHNADMRRKRRTGAADPLAKYRHMDGATFKKLGLSERAGVAAADPDLYRRLRDG